jgi:hypothetical protein
LANDRKAGVSTSVHGAGLLLSHATGRLDYAGSALA